MAKAAQILRMHMKIDRERTIGYACLIWVFCLAATAGADSLRIGGHAPHALPTAHTTAGLIAPAQPGAAESKSQQRWNYVTGMWHYGRGLAFTHSGRLRKAAKELRVLKEIARRAEHGHETAGYANAPAMLSIAAEVLAGQLAAEQKRLNAAIGHLERAVRWQGGLRFQATAAKHF